MTISVSLKAKIGLEVHCQLTNLKTKLFCGCSADYRHDPPNSHTCPVCLGIPGSLPVLNRSAVEDAVMAALALNGEISGRTFFWRKNYPYPDQSKNFQISQFDRAGGVPIAVNGLLTIRINGGEKKIRVRRIHLEEDPGKLTYLGSIDVSPYVLVDYNRSGVALLEIVTEPCFSSPKEARVFLKKLRSVLEHLGVSDGSLEGAMRCDANISVTEGSRVEIKNISSFKEVERALSFEVIRQRDLMQKRLSVRRETRHWDEHRRVTISLRVKEEEHDYRYFPEPDLTPIEIDEGWIQRIRSRMPELPDARKKRFTVQYHLPDYDAEVLTEDKALADFFERCSKLYLDPKKISNWLMGDVLRRLHDLGMEIADCRMRPEHLARMLNLMDRGVISGKIAKALLWDMMETGEEPERIVKQRQLTLIDDRKVIEDIVDHIFSENPQVVEDALRDDRAVNNLVGKLMEATRGRADPNIANQAVRERLSAIRKRGGKA